VNLRSISLVLVSGFARGLAGTKAANRCDWPPTHAGGRCAETSPATELDPSVCSTHANGRSGPTGAKAGSTKAKANFVMKRIDVSGQLVGHRALDLSPQILDDILIATLDGLNGL
jgi:hypothetical protein